MCWLSELFFEDLIFIDLKGDTVCNGVFRMTIDGLPDRLDMRRGRAAAATNDARACLPES